MPPSFASRPTVRGLSNLGNSCFMNASLQCLTQIQPLVNLIFNSGVKNGDKERLVFRLFEEHLKNYYAPSKSGNFNSFSPSGLFRNMKKINFRMVPGRQHDAHEFALGVLGAVEEHYRKEKRSQLFEAAFGGKLVSDITCSKCKHVSSSYESMLSLSLDINKARNINEALKDFFKPDFLVKENKYKCEKCKVKVEAKKQYRIEQAPNVVILHLKRFNYMGRKISKSVEFQEQMAMTEFEKNRPKNPNKYELIGIVEHLGSSLGAGHYVSYVKSGGKWFSCNDSSVGPTEWNRVKRAEGYMLVYQLIKTQNTPQPQSNGNSNLKNQDKIQKVQPSQNGSQTQNISQSSQLESKKSSSNSLPQSSFKKPQTKGNHPLFGSISPSTSLKTSSVASNSWTNFSNNADPSFFSHQPPKPSTPLQHPQKPLDKSPSQALTNPTNQSPNLPEQHSIHVGLSKRAPEIDFQSNGGRVARLVKPKHSKLAHMKTYNVLLNHKRLFGEH